MKIKGSYLALAILATSGLAGCASTAKDTSSSSAAVAANLQAFDLIKAQMEKAVSDDSQKGDLAWFASKKYAEAAKALSEAKEYYAKFSHDPSQMSESGFFDSKSYGDYTKGALSQFQAAYSEALAIKEMVKEKMAIAFENKTILDDLEASEYFSTNYQSIEGKFKSVVDQVAEGKEGAAASIAELESAQAELEIKLVQKLYLSGPKKELVDQKEAKFNLYAPLTLARAEAAIQAVVDFIETHPREIAEIKALSEKASFALERSKQIAQAVIKLRALQNKEHEGYVLAEEKRLHMLAGAAEQGDFRNLNFEQHSQQLQQGIQTLYAEQKAKIGELKAQLSASTNELSAKYDALFAEHEQLKLQNSELAAALAAARQQQEKAKKKIVGLEMALIALKELPVKPEPAEPEVLEAPAATKEATPSKEETAPAEEPEPQKPETGGETEVDSKPVSPEPEVEEPASAR